MNYSITADVEQYNSKCCLYCETEFFWYNPTYIFIFICAYYIRIYYFYLLPIFCLCVNNIYNCYTLYLKKHCVQLCVINNTQYIFLLIIFYIMIYFNILIFSRV